ncbi:MAG: amidohydrolase [Rubrobacter sp.]
MSSFADLAIVGARVRTLDHRRPFATAVAVRDGTIFEVGDDDAVRERCDANTQTIDARGATVVPGLIDAHQHPVWGAEASQGANLNGLKTLDEVRRALAEERARRDEGEWVQGFGLDYNVFEGLRIEGRLIESAIGGNPALVTFVDFHTYLASPRALEISGITGPRAFEGNAEIVCRDGAPTGELREIPAAAIVQGAIPEAGEQARLGWYAEALRAQNAVGITAIHMMDGSPETHEILRRLEAEENLTTRMVAPLWIKPDTSVEEMRSLLPLRDERGRLWRGGVAKFFIDGVIDTGTAWLDEPDTSGDGTRPFWPDPAAYDAAVALFAASGFQVVTHAIGDHAVRRALDAYRAAGAAPGIRHRVEHAETLKDGELNRFVPESVAASMQPLHMQWLRPDMSDSWSQRLGPERSARGFRIKDLLRAGATLAFGSDWPIAHYDPRLGMAWARLRRQPGAGNAEPLIPEQRLSALEALEGYTVGAATAVGEEDVGGRIQRGFRADLTVLARDPVECPADELPDLPVVLTIVEGRVVFGNAEFAWLGEDLVRGTA